MPTGRKHCPVCNTGHTDREILRHIREKHPAAILSTDELDTLGARHCEHCRAVVSKSGKGNHNCVPSRSRAHTSSQQKACSQSALVSSERCDISPEQHAAAIQPEPGQQRAPQTGKRPTDHIRYAAQTVPKGVKTEFSLAAAMLVRKVLETATAGGEEHEQAREDFMWLPYRVLSNTNGSHRRGAKVLGNLKRLKEGSLPDPELLSATNRRATEHRIAKQVHKHLKNGNITRAAAPWRRQRLQSSQPKPERS
jgi:hypothetical protein